MQEHPGLSLLIPVKNEAGNIGALLDEVNAALASRFDLEVVVVDDASTDTTPQELQAAASRYPWLKILTNPKSQGQSRAVWTALWVSSKPHIAVLDGDGQNDPADLNRAWHVYDALQPAGMAIGQRAERQDEWHRLIASRIAASWRRRLLKDTIRDSGCGLKILPRALFLRLPYFDHMHRFMPSLVRREGGSVAPVPISHRERGAGVSKYNNLQRALVGLVDIVGVWWLTKRNKANVLGN